MNRLHLTLIVVVAFLTLSARGAGLLVPTDEKLPPLHITEHLVEVKIQNGVAITELTQTFRNITEQRLEATYIFPLPEHADLTDFQMSFNGTMVQGEVLPAEQARQTYESIVRRMRDPGLIEYIGRRLLKLRVFPVEPKSDTTIKVRYQQVCQPVSSMMAYHYPLRTPGSLGTPGTKGQAHGTVRFLVELNSDAALKNIWSPTHAVEIVRSDDDEHTARVAYEASGGSLNDDFLLLYDTADSDLGLSVVAHRPNADEPGYFVLMMTPRQLWPEQEVQPQDVVFVVDTSGSMAGDKIEQVRQSLKYCVAQLNEQDRFSVVRFSTGFDMLYEELQPATKEHRAKARTWIDQFKAAGGTNISDTLRAVLQLAEGGEADRPFVVVFLTDGRGNRKAPEILSMLSDATPNAESVRIFPFGVGHDVNTKLLDQLSQHYHGKPTYVQPGENLELVLGDFFAVISRPVLTNLKLTLPEIGATERFPAMLGDLYHGQQVILAGRFEETTNGLVTLSATREGERVQYVWPEVKFTHTPEADYVASIWAGRKIAYLIDQIRSTGESDEMIAEVLALSQEFGIQTPYSSWFINPEGETISFGWQRSGRGPGAGPGGGAPTRRPPPARKRRAPGPATGGGGSGVHSDGRGGGAGGSVFGDATSGRIRTIVGSEMDGGEPDADSEFGGIDLLLAEEGVTEEAGAAATAVAKKTAELREAHSRDESRIDENILPARKIDGRWYMRIGSFLVDERFTEETDVVVVRFLSDAYFELIDGHEDLRPVFAVSPRVLVLVDDGVAVLISDRVGAETFSNEQRKQIGLPERSSDRDTSSSS